MIKTLDKSMENLTKRTKQLLESVEIKYKGPMTEGQECESREVVLEHSGNAVVFREVGSDKVARKVAVRGLDIMRSIVAMDESDVTDKIFKQFAEMPASERVPRLPHLRVNLAGRCARNHPVQSQKSLWVRHTTRKVDQQQIISRVYRGKVEDQVAGMKQTVNVKIYKLGLFRKYRQVQVDMEEAEVVANPGDSVDMQKLKKCEGFLSLFCSSSTRRDPGMYHAVTAVLGLEHIVSHAMGSHLFLWVSSYTWSCTSQLPART